MNFLNIHTDTLRSEKYLRSRPVERATWINLLGWCATQENGGIIADAGKWTDRDWLQTCGVTLEEVKDQSGKLYHFDTEGNLLVEDYPIDKENEVRANRENGKKGGRPPKKKPKQNHPVSDKETACFEIVETERKGMEGNEKKRNQKRERKENPVPEATGPGESGSAASLSLPDSSQSGTPPAAPAGPGDPPDVERVMARLVPAYPNAPRNLEPVERDALTDHKAILAEMTDEDWEALRVWTNEATEQSRGCKLWPGNRSQFLQKAGEALEKVRTWWKKSGRKWWEEKEAKRKRREAAKAEKNDLENQDDFDPAEYWKGLEEKPSETKDQPDAEDQRKAG